MPSILQVRKFFEGKRGFPEQHCSLASAVLLEILTQKPQKNLIKKSITPVAGFSGDKMPHVFLHDLDHDVYIDITPDQLGVQKDIYIGEDPILPRDDMLEEFLLHNGIYPRAEVSKHVAQILAMKKDA